MNIIVILTVAVLAMVCVCVLFSKKNKKLKKEIEGLKVELLNLRKEKDLVQMKNYELNQIIEDYQKTQKKIAIAKEKASTAKKQTEAKSEKLKTNSTDRIATASTILSKPKKSSSKN
jgi:uncharacterized protein YlxW (UPF0749 family)